MLAMLIAASMVQGLGGGSLLAYLGIHIECTICAPVLQSCVLSCVQRTWTPEISAVDQEPILTNSGDQIQWLDIIFHIYNVFCTVRK